MHTGSRRTRVHGRGHRVVGRTGTTDRRVKNDGEGPMPIYRMVYGDDEQVVRETFEDVTVEREDGWTVLFRGGDAILRVQDAHVQSLERVDPRPGDQAG